MPDELFDIVDDNDAVTGQALRSIVHARGLWHRGVHILLFTDAGRLLVQKRSASRAQYASLWDCSVSEHVKAGETYLEAARRGLQEEMGVMEIALQPIFKFKMNYGPNDNEISTAYEGIVDPASVHFDPHEVERVDYIRPSDLSVKMKIKGEEFCGWFVQIVGWMLGQPTKLQPLQASQPRHMTFFSQSIS